MIDTSSLAWGKAVIVGNIEVVEEDGDNFKSPLGLVIVFTSPQQIRQAMEDGVVKFTFGD